ncbi:MULTISPECIES: (2Fe-2S) ferredoxin domain-containing protein [Streptomyces]|uniref:(2Fe-2S) ferredoxin domain-containing protein n=1 Tax=Streptomyces TaxID=1883 RepID=UPI00224890AC|nr:(2Fe-2S) ferredoxin domain-containing protein [Streptomyces sp. JHD 1]MCX2970647.1 (2Fe-2S) ferredoxin domain-containing protein [Streptomyces sp. JHD 1]
MTTAPATPPRGARPAPTASDVPAASPEPGCTLVVCRGCCCGDPVKHPRTDHAGQLRRLRAAAHASGGRLAVRTSACLGPCGQANLVVVRPSPAGRRQGGRPVWVGWVMDDACVDDLLEWTAAGGPGLAEPPGALALQFVARPRPHP